MEGLRTLVITHKLITEKEFADFDRDIKKAKASMVNRQ